MIRKIGILIQYPWVDRSAYKLRLLHRFLESGFDVRVFFAHVWPWPYLKAWVSLLPSAGMRAVVSSGGRRSLVMSEARRRKVTAKFTGAFNGSRALKTITAWSPDLLIAAGSGILRKPVIQIPRFGILHIHQGLLPEFRGMDVIPFSALLQGRIGYTIHEIDDGIDTGAALFSEEVSYKAGDAPEEISDRMNMQGADKLADLVNRHRDGQWPRKVHGRTEGRQYYRMSRELKEKLPFAKG